MLSRNSLGVHQLHRTGLFSIDSPGLAERVGRWEIEALGGNDGGIALRARAFKCFYHSHLGSSSKAHFPNYTPHQLSSVSESGSCLLIGEKVLGGWRDGTEGEGACHTSLVTSGHHKRWA